MPDIITSFNKQRVSLPSIGDQGYQPYSSYRIPRYKKLVEVIEQGRNDKLKKLLGQKVAINDYCTHNGLTPIQFAIHCSNYQAFHLLLAYGADPNILALNGNNLLHCTAEKGDATFFRFLLTTGLGYNQDLNTKNNAGLTALDIACQSNCSLIVKTLLMMNCEYIRPGYSALHKAIIQSYNELVANFITFCPDSIHSYDSEGRSPLVMAIICGNIQVVNLLIRNGAKFDSKHLAKSDEEYSFRCLPDKSCCSGKVFCFRNTPPVFIAIECDQPIITALLIKAGCYLDRINPLTGNAILYGAVIREYIDVLQSLIACGCNINIPSEDGDVLNIAIRKKNLQMVKLLIAGNIDFDKNTILFISILAGNAHITKAIMTRPVNINAFDSRGCSPLYYAGSSRNRCTVIKLLAAGADINHLTLKPKDLDQKVVKYIKEISFQIKGQRI